jgi:hypothetical protein
MLIMVLTWLLTLIRIAAGELPSGPSRLSEVQRKHNMTQATEGYYEVSADWLKACGLGNGEAAQAFPVVRSYMAGHLPMVVVQLDNGREWEVIASWRGRYVGVPVSFDPFNI